jgi:hypothetical protein
MLSKLIEPELYSIDIVIITSTSEPSQQLLTFRQYADLTMTRGAKFTKACIVIVLITGMVVGVLTALFGQIHFIYIVLYGQHL